MSARGACAGLLALLTLAAAPLRAQTVDLELVLAVDCSYSVSESEFALQMNGFAAAFRDPQVLAALETAAPNGVAVTLVQWSGRGLHVQAQPWTLLRGAADGKLFADRLAATPRRVGEGSTAIGDALAFSHALLDGNAYAGTRRTIDVSGDGRRNTGRNAKGARDLAVAAGITINGLAILDDDPMLDLYYSNQVVGGAGAFLLTAADWGDFVRAVRIKLLREIGDAPLAYRMR